MKLITAVVRPHVIDRLVVALEDIEDFPGITVAATEGFGQRLGSREDLIGPFKPNRRIEIVAPDELVEPIVSTIKRQAHTGKKGDGIIFVVPLEHSVLV